MHSAQGTLDDKYTLIGERVFLTGVQALVRLPMLQRLRDQAAGLNTAGFISGYRGSPLGALDLNLWKARQHLASHHIVFQPGINEDLAATAVWGSQQLGLFPGARHDGVFAMWYGKGPGVDRCGDVFRHANAAGSARHGGVLVVAGDDHAAKSSSLPHQTEHIFKAVMMPVLYPANVQEYLEFGLHGWAMSRYSGCWVAFKALADTVETSASVLVDPLALTTRIPSDFALPEGGLNIRWPDPPLVQEARLLNYKLYAALAYCRANGLNRVVIDAPAPRLGIITAGKSYLDVMQALDDLGIDMALAREIGIRLYKVGMVWPLEADGVRHFAEGLDEILVVEEKRQFLEYQLKEELYNWREDVRPRVIGKFDEKGEWALIPQAGGYVDHGDWLLSAAGELSPARIARVIAERIGRYFTSPSIRARLALIEAKERSLAQPVIPIVRAPHFCAGCPHNTSTRVPEGSRAVAGIGCHYMVTWMDRATATFTHMGGEGVPWVGQAPFSDERHVFANLGDGTYYHSGLLAIRQAVAAFPPRPGGPGITYKLLYNDAVAMTGGQPVDGPLTVPRIARQLQAEGVGEVVVMTDGTPRDYGPADLPAGTRMTHRDALDTEQRRLREIPGVTVLIYDQTCATEKRRRRKRGTLADPPRRVVINEAVCEGCGDCSEKSGCLAVVPVETPFGRKRAIDQSSCNKDFSCLNGFCPSFVTVEGATLRPGAPQTAEGPASERLPQPALPATAKPYGILVTGVGGTGVVTLGALIGMAAHLDGKGISVLDMTGLAQKYGAVMSHIRIADRQEDIYAARIATGEADLVLGGDVVVSTSTDALTRMHAGRTQAVVSCSETPTAEFTRNPDWQFPLARMQQTLREAVGETGDDGAPGRGRQGEAAPRAHFLDAHALAEYYMGDALYANMLLLGYAWQKGLIPLSLESLMASIRLNAAAVDANQRAFAWGRHLACTPPRQGNTVGADAPLADTDLYALIHQHAQRLADYQDAACAQRYRDAVARIQACEQATLPGQQGLTEAVARYYSKLLAIKDEYEVARLLTSAAFDAHLARQFAGRPGVDYRLTYHLAPPFIAPTDHHTGHPRKLAFPGYWRPFLRLLASCRKLRGSRFDPFGYSAERRRERALIDDYEADMALVIARLPALADDPARLAKARALLALPESIRGYGYIKVAAMERAAQTRAQLRAALEG